MIFFLLDKHPLTYLDPGTLSQKFFKVFPFRQTKVIYENTAHLINYKIRPPPPPGGGGGGSGTTNVFFPHPSDPPCP